MFDVASKVACVLRDEGVENFALRFARQFGLFSLQHYILYRRWGFNEDSSDFEVTVIEVDPDEVTLTQQFPFDVRGEDGIVGEGGGTWHRCVKRFDQHRLFRSLGERFVEGRPWERTEMYRVEMERLARDGAAWNNCRTPAEIRERCDFIEELYDGMRENGYLSQAELRTLADRENEVDGHRKVNGVRFPDELRLAIGPDGQLIRVAGGRHRLAIAKLLEFEAIPAVVQIVHEARPADSPVRNTNGSALSDTS